ncbi:MAG TPA: TIGR03086 family metal-binding protein [Nocardioidaceae bacterium]
MSTRTRPGPPAGSPPWPGAELLERAVAYARVSLALVSPGQLTASTPCRGWDLRQLLAHLGDSLASLHEAGVGGPVALRRHPPPAGDPVAGLQPIVAGLLAGWAADPERGRRDVLVGDRPLTAPVLAAAGALEVTVHGWDVATACGADRPIPAALAVDLLRVAPRLVTDADRPHRFAPPVPAPAAASPGEVLLAFLGRPPR